jgi:hypothetical protein
VGAPVMCDQAMLALAANNTDPASCTGYSCNPATGMCDVRACTRFVCIFCLTRLLLCDVGWSEAWQGVQRWQRVHHQRHLHNGERKIMCEC